MEAEFRFFCFVVVVLLVVVLLRFLERFSIFSIVRDFSTQVLGGRRSRIGWFPGSE